MTFKPNRWIGSIPDLQWIVDARKYSQIYNMNDQALDVDIYRWRDDDGTDETDATWLEIADTTHDFDVNSGNVLSRLRCNVSESGGTKADNQTYTLEFQVNTDGWVALGAATTGCKYFDSTKLVGLTLGYAILIHPKEVEGKWLLSHEFVHVTQYERMGLEKFLGHYLLGLKRFGYARAPLEVEAYEKQLE